MGTFREEIRRALAVPHPLKNFLSFHRAVVGRTSNADAVLEKVVRILLDHGDRRGGLIMQVRAAQALREIADFVRKKKREWGAEQRKRKKEREPPRDLRKSQSFRRDLTEFVRERFAWWEVPLPDELRERIVEVAIPRSTIDSVDMNGGLLRRLAVTVGHEVIGVGPETLARICAALGGHEQTAGRFKRPEDVAHALGDEPVGDSEILRYVLHLLVARGHPQRIADAIMQVWDEERRRIASSDREA